MYNAMPVGTNSIYIFSVTWFAAIDSQSIAHKAFAKVAKRFVYQWERAPSTGNLHCQGYINLRNKSYYSGNKIASCLSALGMKGVTCKPASDAGKEFLKMYCMKEDTRVAGPWADRPIYRGQDLVCMSKPFPWQKDIIERIACPPNDRDIIWINDAGGNVGKSKLVKYLKYKKLAVKIPMGNATQLKTNVIAQGASRCYVIDIPRTVGSTEKMSDLISAIEEVKNGDVTSAMYGKVQELLMQPPHVIVFSNQPPPYGLMSADRWKVFGVHPLLKILAGVAKNS